MKLMYGLGMRRGIKSGVSGNRTHPILQKIH